VALSQQVPESVRVVGPVGNHCGRLMLTHEQLRLPRVVFLAGAEADFDRLSPTITG